MNFWKSYGAHLLGYVSAAVGTAIALTPQAVSAFPQLAPLAPYVGPTGIVALVAAAAGIAVHQSQAPTATAAGTVTLAAKAILMALLVLPFMAGCSTISAWLGSPVGEATVVAAVDVAVATAEQKGVSAAQINSIAHQALLADQGATASLVAISAVVNAQIAKLNLPAGDLAAANILEAALTVAVAEKIAGNTSLAQAQAAAADVINAVIAVTGG